MSLSIKMSWNLKFERVDSYVTYTEQESKYITEKFVAT